MLIPGLCSVTFRKLAPREIVELTRQAGLACIEWGGDVHVPPGDEARAREVGAMTSDAGLRNISYGSYYRPGPDEDLAAFDAVIAAAEGLGAINIRVWAGARASADADAAYREAVAEALLDCARRAEDEGMVVSLEYHAGSLTDTAVSTLELLRTTKRAGVRTYWQPPVGMPEKQALKDL